MTTRLKNRNTIAVARNSHNIINVQRESSLMLQQGGDVATKTTSIRNDQDHRYRSSREKENTRKKRCHRKENAINFQDRTYPQDQDCVAEVDVSMQLREHLLHLRKILLASEQYNEEKNRSGGLS